MVMDGGGCCLTCQHLHTLPIAKQCALESAMDLVLPLLGPKVVLTQTCHTSSKFSHLVTLRNLENKVEEY